MRDPGEGLAVSSTSGCARSADDPQLSNFDSLWLVGVSDRDTDSRKIQRPDTRAAVAGSEEEGFGRRQAGKGLPRIRGRLCPDRGNRHLPESWGLSAVSGRREFEIATRLAAPARFRLWSAGPQVASRSSKIGQNLKLMDIQVLILNACSVRLCTAELVSECRSSVPSRPNLGESHAWTLCVVRGAIRRRRDA